MNDLLYNKKTAYVTLFLMVLISIFIIGGNDIRREQQRILDVMNGYNELGINVVDESEIILANSSNLLVVASRYVSTSGRRLVEMRQFGDPNAEEWENNFSRVDEFMPDVHQLINELGALDIENRSAAQLTEIVINIDAASRRIRLSGYNDAAHNFNRVLRNPYTGTIAAVRGISSFRTVGEW